MALMSTMCNYWIQWGLIKANPFVGMMQNKAEKDVRAIERHQILRFYLWALRQDQAYRTMGVAAMFCYLTGFRAAEVRPYHVPGLTDVGVRVVGAKRKKGEAQTVKLRHWSPRLHAVVERAKRGRKVDSLFLFPNRKGQMYSKSGWASVWQDAMYADYFSLQDIRPAALTTKLENRSADAYDFAAHSNPSTTHRHYDRRKVKAASATE
ncbi:tyrosine-type recombinase/integrase [Burkholderia stagnalis]|uniref:tyrosine-type recombinase/integrase n=1 Tax=Burkholderia stagnalis TaxID=1503054 RepID=UPI0012D86C21|nr:hypothetical protein [Burkholderia stagnalis]